MKSTAAKRAVRLRHDPTPALIIQRLRDHFGAPRIPRKRPPLDELVRTILSQNTNDRNRDRAYNSMKERYPTWDKVLESSVEELEAAIAPAGLGPTKSRRIWDILKAASDVNGSALEKICELSREEAFARLTGLKGVGPKTASCVLLFSCGIPAFPVDTHVFRVSGRLGLLGPGEGRVKAHAVLEEYFQPDDYLEAHLNMIALGRHVCRPRQPRCHQCPLGDCCPSYLMTSQKVIDAPRVGRPNQ